MAKSGSSQEPKAIRLEVRFSGSVQGVGFRQTTQSIARSHAVTGYVKNLANGQVSLVVEGIEQAVTCFVAAVAERMSEFIDNRQENRLPATGEFTAFEIRY